MDLRLFRLTWIRNRVTWNPGHYDKFSKNTKTFVFEKEGDERLFTSIKLRAKMVKESEVKSQVRELLRNSDFRVGDTNGHALNVLLTTARVKGFTKVVRIVI